jgi:hypothetical protein
VEKIDNWNNLKTTILKKFVWNFLLGLYEEEPPGKAFVLYKKFKIEGVN